MLGGMTEEEFLAAEGLTQARAISRMLEATDVPELLEARRQAALASARLGELVRVAEVEDVVEALDRVPEIAEQLGIPRSEARRRIVMGELDA